MIPASRTYLALILCFAFLTLASCGKDSPTEPVPETPAPTRISVTPASATLTAAGQALQLTAAVLDQHGQAITGAGVTWTSSDTNIVTVTDQGLVTAVMNGTARITAATGSITAFATISVEVPDPERDALVAFYNGTDGDNWTIKTNWMSDAPLRDWHGVILNGEGRVEELHLPGNNLRGSLPAEISALEKLKRLVLFGNGLAGYIPPEIGQLGNLVELNLSSNQFTGNLPAEIGRLDDLTLLFVDDNIGLYGPLPRSMLNLTFTVIWVVGTQLCLPADVEFQEWSNAITNNRGLAECSVERNALVTLYNSTDGGNWTINTKWLTDAPLAEWYGVTTNTEGLVTELMLEDNNLRGNLPIEITHLEHLTALVLSKNRLTGSIPPEIGRLKQLKRLRLYSNLLTGPIPPELGQLENLETIVLLENRLTGSIPPELGQLKKTWWLTVSGNRLTGPIPPELGQLESLERVFLYNNFLTGSLPPELGQLQHLTIAELSDNQLSGSIPPEIGQMAKLEKLLLSYNRLSGSLPPELGQLENLQTLWLDNNQLTGDIPPELGQLGNLRVLWLYNNRLTGDIPPELGRMRHLTRLSLSVNMLSGAIPPELGTLHNLRILLLRDNPGLAGPLPRSFTGLDLLSLWLAGTGVCVPPGDEFNMWLAGISDRRGVARCQPDMATTSTGNGNPGGIQANGISISPDGSVTDLDLEENRLRGDSYQAIPF